MTLQTVVIPARPEPIRIDPRRTALVVVDVQNAYLSKGGYIDLVGFDVSLAPGVISHIRRAINAARLAGLPIIYFQNGFSLALAEMENRASPLYYKSNALKFMRDHPERYGQLITEGGWDYEFVPELAPKSGDLVIKKARYSGFAGTSFDQTLRARGITTLIVIGVNTNVCVESTIRDAYHREYFALMVPEATMPSGDRTIYDATVFNVERFVGWTATTADLCEALGGQAAEPAAGVTVADATLR